jgi:hypothetical protein
MQPHLVDRSARLDTISLASNGERRAVKPIDQRPLWNTSTISQPSKTPRSVFLDGDAPVDRPISRPEVTTPMKVMPVVKTLNEHPVTNGAKTIYYQPQPTTYVTTTKVARADPEGNHESVDHKKRR